MNLEELMKMDIGEVVFDNKVGHIHRVPGGWIYQFAEGVVLVSLPAGEEPKKKPAKKPIVK